jgi:hypothetical protein
MVRQTYRPTKSEKKLAPTKDPARPAPVSSKCLSEKFLNQMNHL